jgi:hypothetical protein
MNLLTLLPRGRQIASSERSDLHCHLANERLWQVAAHASPMVDDYGL